MIKCSVFSRFTIYLTIELIAYYTHNSYANIYWSMLYLIVVKRRHLMLDKTGGRKLNAWALIWFIAMGWGMWDSLDYARYFLIRSKNNLYSVKYWKKNVKNHVTYTYSTRNILNGNLQPNMNQWLFCTFDLLILCRIN